MDPHPLSPHTLSFEVLPPRRPEQAPRFWSNLDQLLTARPDFISVTYGAGGTDKVVAQEIVSELARNTPVQPIAHLTCVATCRADVRSVIERYLDLGVRTFMALRGDTPKGMENWEPSIGDPTSATELVTLMRQIETERITRHPGAALRAAVHPLTIAVATFPAGNPAAGSTPEDEAERLLTKQIAGASFAVTQLFWNPDYYHSFVERARRIGVTIPIVAGILPPTDPKRVRRMEQLTGVEAPDWLLKPLESASTPEGAADIGIGFGRDIARSVLEAGSPGIHVYSFNQAAPALALIRDLNLSNPHVPARQTDLKGSK